MAVPALLNGASAGSDGLTWPHTAGVNPLHVLVTYSCGRHAKHRPNEARLGRVECVRATRVPFTIRR